ncbi:MULTISPECIES: asparaginase [Megasphaera]|uniref:asparaginase n=1 Tax=Megasphaera TaxID=906 RepID=UPI000B3BD053|nr:MULTISPECIES: asparaginase [Megasphaera]OUO46197.1 L-asparaginase [Megasphaera sp. An286]HJE82461.1 asparaginase [Megasphaera stantonii]
MALPNIYIVACGGTIAGKAATEEDLTGYTAGAATIDEVLQAVPAVHQYARIRGEQFCSIDSSDMSEGLWLALAARVQELAGRDDVDGIVVTHGTDTMEETAYFLNLAVHTEKPVVFVGSMRPATAISADGPLNLLEAVQAAAQAETGHYGVVIVMNGTICSARFVEKTDTTHVDTFKSRQLGYIGLMQDGMPMFYQAPLRRHTYESGLSCSGCAALPPVVVAYAYVGMERWIESLIPQDVCGLVLAGFGHGRMPGAVWQSLQKAMKEGLVVVRASRTLGGAVTPIAEYEGTICADTLTPQKAKILLQLTLLKTRNIQEIKEAFREY